MDAMDVYYSRCRLCAGVHSLGINIFGEEGTKMEVKHKINKYLYLDVEVEDALPKNICYLCLGHIEEFHKFKTMCSESQLTLKNWNQCLDDEDMSFCAEYNCTPEFEDREGNGLYCSSFLSTDSNATANSAENSSGRHLEESGNEHTFSSKKRQKTNVRTSHKVKSNRLGIRTEQNSSEMLITKGPSETYANVNGLCSSTLSRYNSVPSRRIIGSHNKNTMQQIVQLEDFTTSDDDDEDEVGFPGFVAERRASTGYKRGTDSSPSLENETVGENNREREQNKFSGPDYYVARMQDSQTDSEAELFSVVKQEPAEETYPQHKCSACHRIFTRSSTLKEHLKMHLGNDTYKCPSCGKPFGNNYGLILHMNTHKTEEYKCCECSKEFSQEKTLLEHIQIHHRVKQHVPKTSTPNVQFLQNTALMQNKKDKKQRTYRCKFCETNFQDKRSCTDHMRCHFAEKPYACNLCDRRFTRQSNLMAHLKVHRSEPFICRLCKSSFSSKAELTEHLSLAHRDVILEVVNDANHGNDNL